MAASTLFTDPNSQANVSDLKCVSYDLQVTASFELKQLVGQAGMFGLGFSLTCEGGADF